MRRLLGVLLACAVLPFAAGCGDTGDSVKNAVDPVAQAATNTANAGTVQLSMTGSVSASGIEIPLRSTGAFDLKNKRGHMEVTTSVPGKGDIKIEELLDGLVVYMRSDALTSNLPSGKHWIKLDLQKLGKQAGVDLSQLQQLGGGTDPTQFLTYLKKAGDVQKVGSENIDGTPTTHYRATIDLDKLAASAGKAASSVRQLEQLTGGKTLPTDIWIDAQGRARRQALDYTVKQPTQSRVQFTIDYQKFGVPVDVQKPDDGDTVDLAQALGG
jgi:hypothetical protein